jgi:hypothetical protein
VDAVALSDARMKMLQMRLWRRTGRAVTEAERPESQWSRVVLPNLPLKTSQVIDALLGPWALPANFQVKIV